MGLSLKHSNCKLGDPELTSGMPSWGREALQTCLGGLQMALENTEKELFTTKHLASFPLERFN